MKQLILNISLISSALLALMGCEKTGNFPGAEVSPYVAIYDLRSYYKGDDYPLSKSSMLGYTSIAGVVVSDHRGKNLPAGLLMVQDKLRLNQLRGITINIGADAEKYVPGDSVTVNLEGGVMKRVDGLLQVTGLSGAAVTKIASDVPIAINRVPSSYILENPEIYESTELVIVKGGFDPIPAPTETYSGDRVVNDGFGNFILHTEPGATFANTPLPGMANFKGVLQYASVNGKPTPHLRIRRDEDITVLSSTVTQAAIVVSGFVTDVEGTDLDGEYMQFLATRDIDFSVTPFSVVTSNNTSSYTPTGFPVNGWATGGLRNYKFNLTSGFAAKGTYFYVGNLSKLINGQNSTSMAHANWILSKNYGGTPGDGFGQQNTNLFINSGTFTCGIAVFEGTTVDKNSIPIDVVFIGYNGSVLNANANPPVGLRITNTDWYDVVNPVTLESQPFYKQGSNTICLAYGTPADAGWFYKMGGVYNVRLGRWVKARAQRAVDLTKNSTLSELEEEFPLGDGVTEGLQPTKVID
jgi:hypothetical protein